MIRSKRDQFRKELRRRQIESIFSLKRQQLLILNQQNFQAFALQVRQSSLPQQVQSIVSEIHSLVLDSLQHPQSIRTLHSAIIDSLDKIIALLEKTPLQASYAVFLQDQPLGNFFSKCLRNRTCQKSKQNEEQMEWRPVCSEEHLAMVGKILEVFAGLKYEMSEESTFSSLSASFWELLVMVNNPYSTEESIHKESGACVPTIRDVYMQQIMDVLNRMLSSHKQSIFARLKNQSLGYHLSSLVQTLEHYSPLTVPQEELFIQIIYQYLLQESKLEISTSLGEQKSNKVGDVFIMGLDSTQKQRLMLFAIHLIHKKEEGRMLSKSLAISILILIFQSHQYLCDSLTPTTLQQICKLSVVLNRDLQMKAVELINDMTFYSIDLTDKVMEGMMVIDIVYQILIRQSNLKTTDKAESNYIVVACMNITRNAVLTKSRHLRQMLWEHHIWNLAFETLSQPGTRLFPFVGVFEYYLDACPRKMLLQMWENFVCAISELQIQYVSEKEINSLKNAVQRVAWRASERNNESYWDQNSTDFIMNAIYKYKMNHWLDDEMEEEL